MVSDCIGKAETGRRFHRRAVADMVSGCLNDVHGILDWGLELRAEENEEESVACDGVGDGLEKEGKELAFHEF